MTDILSRLDHFIRLKNWGGSTHSIRNLLAEVKAELEKGSSIVVPSGNCRICHLPISNAERVQGDGTCNACRQGRASERGKL